MREIKINSKEFFTKWKEISVQQHNNLSTNWSNATKFTSCIFTDEVSMLKAISKELSLSCAFNYYSLDAVFYKEQDLVPGILEVNTWLRNIRIAFEHENNFSSGLFQEVSHLLITKCDLRVLVTYPDNNYDWEMERLHNLISGADEAKEISDQASFMLIFGYKSKDCLVDWEAVVFNIDGWVPLNIDIPIVLPIV